MRHQSPRTDRRHPRRRRVLAMLREDSDYRCWRRRAACVAVAATGSGVPAAPSAAGTRCWHSVRQTASRHIRRRFDRRRQRQADVPHSIAVSHSANRPSQRRSGERPDPVGLARPTHTGRGGRRDRPAAVEADTRCRAAPGPSRRGQACPRAVVRPRTCDAPVERRRRVRSASGASARTADASTTDPGPTCSRRRWRRPPATPRRR